MNRLVVCLVIISLASACATQYEPQGATGGFTETRLSPEVYRVSFNGNRRTSISRATDFTLLRCAELTLQNEFTHFVIIEENQWTNDEISVARDPARQQMPDLIDTDSSRSRVLRTQSPRSTNTISMLNTTDGIDAEVFDAAFIVKSLKTKYSIE